MWFKIVTIEVNLIQVCAEDLLKYYNCLLTHTGMSPFKIDKNT
jgi:hypothetical protein